MPGITADKLLSLPSPLPALGRQGGLLALQGGVEGGLPAEGRQVHQLLLALQGRPAEEAGGEHLGGGLQVTAGKYTFCAEGDCTVLY